MTLEEITAAARHQLTLHGARGFSLRAVAREVGLTPSAIYRYYDSQSDLIAAVAVTASEQAWQQLRAAAESGDAGARDRMHAVFTAYRTWARRHPGEFELLCATDQALLSEPSSPASASGPLRLCQVPLEVYAEGLAGRPPVTDPPESPASPALSATTTALRQEVAQRTGAPLDDRCCHALLSAWYSVHGFVCLESFGHLEHLVDDPDASFEAHLHSVLDRLGLDRR